MTNMAQRLLDAFEKRDVALVDASNDETLTMAHQTTILDALEEALGYDPAPTPRDEISAMAGRLMQHEDPEVRKVAAFAVRADTQKGPNDGR